ncbi:MAG: HEAT repeat domain-containing protein [Desulfobacteraceae bacterium]|nr:HEAT repeat domain-containing protein [Desulfobacteraceae bacterium]
MSPQRMSSRQRKRKVLELLGSGDLDRALDSLCQMPARQIINPLLSFLVTTDPKIKWASVTAIGVVVANLADHDREDARVVMRRLMWQLNDESGGIGWGCPEAMGEIIACHAGLAGEFAEVLVSYVREDGNFLEYEPLQRGAVWGIGRVAQVDSHLVDDSIPHLLPFLKSPDAALRGLTAWALGLLGAQEAYLGIEGLLGDPSAVEIYRDRKLGVLPVMNLATEALARLKNA